MRWMIGISLLGMIVASPQSRSQNQSWVASALPERAYDFGTVARGSQVRHSFPIINRTDSELRIVDWRTKCGCTDVRVGSKIIPPGTQTTVEATIDTTKFVRDKHSGLILVFDRPEYAEVNLNLSCFIRGDLTMSPGQIDFGIVRRSEKMAQASLTLTYAGGRSDWEVTKMKTLSNKIKAELRELGRTAEGQINYSLTASLQPGIPNGCFQGRDHPLDQRLDEPDDTDLGGGQHPERGVGHAVDHQFRRRSSRANDLQNRDRPFVSTVLDHEAFSQPGSSRAC